MSRWDDSFSDRHLELISTALIQWNEQIKATISDERFSEEIREHKRNFSGELTELIQEIRGEMYRRVETYESN